MIEEERRPVVGVVLPDLRVGGAERLHVSLSNAWMERGVSTRFILRRARGELIEELPESASVVNLNSQRVRGVLWPLARHLRQHSPDALLVAMWPLTVLVPIVARIAGYRGRIVISEHAPLSRSYAGRGALHRILLRMSMMISYRMVDSCVAVSSGVADDIAKLACISRDRIRVIYNPAALGAAVSAEGSVPTLLGHVSGPVYLSVGTLKAVKRHDLIIQAFARMNVAGSVLVILGDGPERGSLEALIRRLGLEDRVFLPGHQKTTANWYSNSDAFVLASDHEGFGNVLVEALEHGLAIVSTDCPFGPREILANGEYGYLVPVGDVEALSAAMVKAISSERDIEKLKRRAAEFGVDQAADSYLSVLL